MAALTVSAFAGEHALASSAIHRSLILNPNCAQAWGVSGYISFYQNEPVSAIAAFERAMRLSPLDPIGYDFAGGRAMAHLAAREYQQAREWADRSLREMPRNALALRVKVVSCIEMDRTDEAHAALARLREFQPELTIAAFQAIATRNFAPEILAVYIDGLRKAGLPEA